jgi:hypothetical protein
MKIRAVCRKLYDYVRYDLKEIAFPSSLPAGAKTEKKVARVKKIVTTIDNMYHHSV